MYQIRTVKNNELIGIYEDVNDAVRWVAFSDDIRKYYIYNAEMDVNINIYIGERPPRHR